MQILLSYHVTGYVSAFMISTGLAFYLLSLRAKTRQTWLLGAYFLVTAALSGGFLLRASLFHPDIAKPASYLIAVYTCFSNVVLLAFAYDFPVRRLKGEGRIMVLVFAALGAVAYGYYVLTSIDDPVRYNFETLLHEFQRPESARPMGIAHTITFFWILAVCVRKSRAARLPDNATLDAEEAFRLARERRSMRALALAVVLHLCFAGVYALYTARKVTFADFQLILTAANSIQLFVYALIYFNYSTQPTSFLVKLVGVSLLTLLVALGLIYRITFKDHERAYYSSMRFETIAAGLGIRDSSVPFEYVRRTAGGIGGELSGLPACEKDGVFFSQADTANPARYITHLCINTADGFVQSGVSYLSFRHSMHEHMVPLTAAILGLGTLMVVFFPLFFYAGLLSPLQALLVGVRRVNAGDYESRVHREFEDEIGFLSTSFNTMVASIAEGRTRLQAYATHLEEMVKERTNRLQQSLDQIKELKVRQDGDYYLASLLVAPVTRNKAESEVFRVESRVRQMKQFEYNGWQAEIGGDLNVGAVVTLRNKKYIVVLNADAMGKSLQGAAGALVLGAVFEAILKRTLQNSVFRELSPERWLKNAFIELDSVFRSFDCSMMASAVLGLVDEETGVFYFTCVEHPLPVLYRQGVASFLPAAHQYFKFGIPFERGPIAVNVFQLNPGDVIISGSDGRQDLLLRSGANPEDWIVSQDEELFLTCVEKGAGDLERIENEVQRTGTLIDDLSLLRLEYALAPDPEELGGLAEIEDQIRTCRLRGKHRKAAELARQAIPAAASRAARVRFSRWLFTSLYRARDLKGAVEAGTAYVTLNPGDTLALALAATVMEEHGDFEMAIDLGERVKLRMPGYRRNIRLLARAYKKSGDSARAAVLEQEVSL